MARRENVARLLLADRLAHLLVDRRDDRRFDPASSENAEFAVLALFHAPKACAGRGASVKFRRSDQDRLDSRLGQRGFWLKLHASLAGTRRRFAHADRSDGSFHHSHHQRKETVAFYHDILGFTPGPRPAFSFPGAWLYNDGKAVLHVVEKSTIPEGGGVLDHIAFFGTDAQGYLAKLKARGIKHNLVRLPQAGHAAGVWQLFFFDPSGAQGRDRLCGERDRRRAGLRRIASCRGALAALAIEPALPLRPAGRKRDISLRNNAIVQVGQGPLAARFGPKLPLALIAGPCQLESRAHALEMAAALKEIAGAARGRPRVQIVVRQGQSHLGHRPGAGSD